MRFVFFGAYDPSYPRNAVIRKGLARIDVETAERRAPRELKFWARYPLLILKKDRPSPRPRRGPSYFFVPEFGQKDVPLARFLALLKGGKVVFDPLAARHETKIVDWRRKPADSPSAWWNKMIDAAAFRSSDLVLADTAAHAEFFRRTYGLDPAKVAVLPLGYDDDFFRIEEAVLPDGRNRAEFTALFFGSFLPLHGAEAIVEAARIVAGEDPGVRFTMIGDGQTFPAVKAAAGSLGNIVFAGRKPFRELPAAIAAADLCLGIFGRTEKARRVVPHKIFQSMAMGKAVITARTPAVEEFFTDGENIVLCDEPFPRTIAEKILALKRDKARRARVAENGARLVRREFSPEAVARRLVAAVERRFGRG